MSLDPLKSGTRPAPTGGRECRSVPGSDAAIAREDSLPQGTIAADRLREIVRRMERGHYDRGEVYDVVARRALPHLSSPGAD